MDRTPQSAPKHPLSSGMDHALDGEAQGPVKQLRRPGDNGPDMQSAANNSAQVKQLRAAESAANAAVVQRHKANTTGLPDDLKVGIESLSGLSLDHITVEYNSSKPAKVNALAYAEGDTIYVAPGQAQHLPEEAWHIVQQMQGKVKATTEVGGKAINDDPGLEKEAREMGAKAQATTATPATDPSAVAGTGAQGPIQRRVYEPFEENDPSNLFLRARAAAATIDGEVTKARQVAINFSALDPGSNNFLKQWKNAAQKYATNPEVQPKLLHARFGYAIETIASAAIKGKTLNGLTVHLQEAHGHTRPDVVLKENGEPVAWLDITAEGSANHIFDKKSTGWTTKPYVAEIIYKSLELSEVLADQNDPMINMLASLFGAKTKMEYGEVEKERYLLQADLLNHGKDYDLAGDQKKKRDQTRDYLRDQLSMDMRGEAVKATKGALRYAKINPSVYGFKGSKQKETTIPAQEYTQKKAAMAIMKGNKAINERASQYLRKELAAYQHQPFVKQYIEKAFQMEKEVERRFYVLPELIEQDEFTPEIQQKMAELVDKQSELVERGIAMLNALPLMTKLFERAKLFGQTGVETPVMAAISIRQLIDKAVNHTTATEWRASYFLFKQMAEKMDLPAEILKIKEPEFEDDIIEEDDEEFEELSGEEDFEDEEVVQETQSTSKVDDNLMEEVIF